MAASRNIREAAIFRTLILIAIGAAFAAFALGFVSLGEQPPIFLRIMFGLLGTLAMYGGLHHLRFLFRRRNALAGGRDRKGTLQLRGKLDDESGTALAIFSTSYGEWVLMLDPGKIRARETEFREGVPARATVDEDDRIYALRIGSESFVLQSESIAFDGKMRLAIEKSESWMAERDKKRSG
ncbi:hypothetical protein [Aurantiacibacter marinus]|uniref:Uncharacterized protein n=1 Tax=Aurantiacibacter marinus TaxID=874156 RepID=A0A0H0XKW8_9SPHN|nr:hypothetical protein [Aurantiacibacter marinus]KLI62979.1 hypothetical protein AAV99_13150 [Aurantiacibacter marinus]